MPLCESYKGDGNRRKAGKRTGNFRPGNQGDGILLELVILACLILLNAFFAASEIAFISLNDNKLQMQAEEGDGKAKAMLALTREPSRFLATIQIGITLAGFLASALAADRFSETVADWAAHAGVPLPYATLDAIAVIAITLILSYFTLVFGELVPKRLAMQKAETIARLAVRPLSLLAAVTSPFVKFLSLSTNVTVRLFGVDPHADEEQVTEEEIRLLVDAGKKKGAIREAESIMIDNIFEFDNKIASDIMTHRTNIAAIRHNASLADVIAFVNRTRFTRYPVFGAGLDDIIGILHVKELIRFAGGSENRAFRLRDLCRKPYHAPVSRPTDQLFRDMQARKEHMAIIIDEYGGTAGLVTIEDLLEEIVGNIFDEYDEVTEQIVPLEDGQWLADGIVSLDEVENLLRAGLPVEDYDTLNGFLTGELGRLPEPGETPEISFGGCVFRVSEVGERRIGKVVISRTAPPDGGQRRKNNH